MGRIAGAPLFFQPQPHPPDPPMNPTPPPLTHHEILKWVGPFTRAGRHVDLAASDRIARRLAFKPIEHDAAEVDGVALPALRETLQLESTGAERFRLIRTLTSADGVTAGLEAEGPRPGDLLARVQAVPAQRQVVAGPGYSIAQSHRIDEAPERAPSRQASAPRLALIRGVARVGELTLTLEAPTVRGMSADLVLTMSGGDAIVLPDDLLAVLGRDWSRLGEAADGWRSSLRLRGRGLGRSRDAEAKLERAAAHLARSLSEPPARFHERHRAARWRVMARRAVPLLVCVALVLAAASVPKLHLADDSPWRMLIFNAPPLLLILVFCLRELPRIELPRRPRRSTAAAWRAARSSR